MSQSADEAWGKVDTQLAEALNTWPMGVHVSVAMQRAAEATAREIAREEVEKMALAVHADMDVLRARIHRLEVLAAHYQGGMDVDKDSQDEAETTCMDCGEDTGAGVLFCRKCHEARERRIGDLQAEQERGSGIRTCIHCGAVEGNESSPLCWGHTNSRADHEYLDSTSPPTTSEPPDNRQGEAGVGRGGGDQDREDGPKPLPVWISAEDYEMLASGQGYPFECHPREDSLPSDGPYHRMLIAPAAQGGDADAVAERHDRRSERPNVTTGAGATSEQDAPAPQRYRIDGNGRDVLRNHLRIYGERDDAEARANWIADELESHIVPEPIPAPSEGEEREVEPAWLLGPTELLKHHGEKGVAEILTNNVHDLLRELEEGKAEVALLQRLNDNQAGTIQGLRGSVQVAANTNASLTNEIARLRRGRGEMKLIMKGYRRELEAEREANRQLQRLNDNQASTIQSFMDQVEKQHDENARLQRELNTALELEKELLKQIRLTTEQRNRLRAENARLREELDTYQSDMEEAAGHLMVDLPDPGTDVAKLLAANSLLRQKAARLRDPANWEVVNQATGAPIHHTYAVRYVDPPESEGESDET